MRMNILFLSTNTNKSYNEPVLSQIRKLKYDVMDASFNDSIADKAAAIAKATREIKRSDAIIIEGTETNFDLGRLLTLTVLQHKPVLIFQLRGKGEHLELGSNRLVVYKKYIPENMEEIGKNIESFSGIVDQQRLTYRFNLMLSKNINEYLMTSAQKRGISKADYIRNLIFTDMGA